jgi:hypothetical protein
MQRLVQRLRRDIEVDQAGRLRPTGYRANEQHDEAGKALAQPGVSAKNVILAAEHESGMTAYGHQSFTPGVAPRS